MAHLTALYIPVNCNDKKYILLYSVLLSAFNYSLPVFRLITHSLHLSLTPSLSIFLTNCTERICSVLFFAIHLFTCNASVIHAVLLHSCLTWIPVLTFCFPLLTSSFSFHLLSFPLLSISPCLTITFYLQ